MPKDLNVDEFFTDPKYSKDADFMKSAVNKIIDMRMEEEKKKKPKQLGFFESLFGSNESE